MDEAYLQSSLGLGFGILGGVEMGHPRALLLTGYIKDGCLSMETLIK